MELTQNACKFQLFMYLARRFTQIQYELKFMLNIQVGKKAYYNKFGTRAYGEQRKSLRRGVRTEPTE